MEHDRIIKWVNMVALGAAVCCVAALGVLLFFRQAPAEETQPPQTSIESPVPSDTVPVISTTEPPAVETTAQPTETEEPVETELSIRDSAAYQKLLSLENANQFDPEVLEAFARWIEAEEGFLEAYPEKWKLTLYADGGAGLVCHSPLDEDHKCRYYQLSSYDYGGLILGETGERLFTTIPREEVAAKVYGAEDLIGVSDGIKEAFVDCIMDSDWFPWSTMDPEFRTEWSFGMRTYGEEQTECITLLVNVWMPGMAEGEAVLCSLFYNGNEVRNGTNDTGFKGGILSSTWVDKIGR